MYVCKVVVVGCRFGLSIVPPPPQKKNHPYLFFLDSSTGFCSYCPWSCKGVLVSTHDLVADDLKKAIPLHNHDFWYPQILISHEDFLFHVYKWKLVFSCKRKREKEKEKERNGQFRIVVPIDGLKEFMHWTTVKETWLKLNYWKLWQTVQGRSNSSRYGKNRIFHDAII